jgi:hypothetical protein
VKVRPIRWFLALTLAAALAPLTAIAATFLGGNTSKAISLAAFAFGTSWMMWLAGTTALGAFSSRRGTAYPMAYCLLGALLAYLVPLAELVVIIRVLPRIIPEMAPIYRSKEVPIRAALTAGIYQIPFGLLSGWLFWRLAARPSRAAVERSDQGEMAKSNDFGRENGMPHQRRWLDLRMGRLFSALMLAAGVPWVVLIVVAAPHYVGVTSPTDILYGLAGGLIYLEVWFLAVGLLFLFAVCRRRGNIRRGDCLLLGTLLTCSFLVFAVVVVFAVGLSLEGGAGYGTVSQFMTAIAVSIVLIPFGLLSGWVLWRVGVRPAKEPDLRVAPVFD